MIKKKGKKNESKKRRSCLVLTVILSISLIVTVFVPTELVFATDLSATSRKLSQDQLDQRAEALLNEKVVPANDDPNSPMRIHMNDESANIEGVELIEQDKIVDVRKVRSYGNEEEYQATVIFDETYEIMEPNAEKPATQIRPFSTRTENSTLSTVVTTATITYTKKVVTTDKNNKENAYNITKLTGKVKPKASTTKIRDYSMFVKTNGARFNSNGKRVGGSGEKKGFAKVAKPVSGKVYSMTSGQKYWYCPALFSDITFNYGQIQFLAATKTCKGYHAKKLIIGWE